MKKIYYLVLVFLAISCSSSNSREDPLILPPNFAETPDVKNASKNIEKPSQENIEKLKDLLLKSDEN